MVRIRVRARTRVRVGVRSGARVRVHPGVAAAALQGLHDLVFADPGADYISITLIPLLSYALYRMVALPLTLSAP